MVHMAKKGYIYHTLLIEALVRVLYDSMCMDLVYMLLNELRTALLPLDSSPSCSAQEGQRRLENHCKEQSTGAYPGMRERNPKLCRLLTRGCVHMLQYKQ